MSPHRIPSLALLAALTGGLAITAPAAADPSAAPEYLYQLPERQWVIGGPRLAAGGRCGRETCEAGYRSGDLVLSVRRAAYSVEAVAGVRGCPSAATRTVQPSTFETASLTEQYGAIQRAALSAARTARSQCGSGVSDLIDTAALVRIVPGQAY